jgi:hypothetical protein
MKSLALSAYLGLTLCVIAVACGGRTTPSPDAGEAGDGGEPVGDAGDEFSDATGGPESSVGADTGPDSADSGADASDANNARDANDAYDAYDAYDAGCVPAPSGLVAWWRAEGNTADAVGANNGVATDVSYVSGAVGQAFHFNGPTVESYVTASALGLPTGSDDRTIEAWVRLDTSHQGIDPSYSDGLFVGYGGWGTPNATYELVATGGAGASNDALTFSQWGNGYVSGVLTELAWHHVAATWSGGTLMMYLDGSLSTMQVGIAPLTTIAGGAVYLGGLAQAAVPGQNPAWLGGDVDEASIYSRVLSAAEIHGIYAAGSAGKCP